MLAALDFVVLIDCWLAGVKEQLDDGGDLGTITGIEIYVGVCIVWFGQKLVGFFTWTKLWGWSSLLFRVRAICM